jgi:hypothetical protein
MVLHVKRGSERFQVMAKDGHSRWGLKRLQDILIQMHTVCSVRL